jgi:prepilin-type N-terminal cleavage/methylation domain-containing protein
MRCSSQHGFSLIELSIIIAIFSVLMAGMLGGRTIQREAERVEGADASMDAAQKALQYFFQEKGYLPCPASLTAAPGTVNYGISTDCALTAAPAGTTHIGTATDEYQLRVGALPTRTLGMADGAGVDGWGNRLTYVIPRMLGVDAAGYTGYAPTQTTGFFQLTDAAGTVTYGSSTSEIIAYALISHGADGRGAYTKDGIAGIGCATTEADKENCDADKQWIDAPVNDQVTGATYYYDFTRWIKKSDLDAL